jgi:hypothetical protein
VSGFLSQSLQKLTKATLLAAICCAPNAWSADLIAPDPNLIVAESTLLLEWNDETGLADKFWVYVGTEANSHDIFNSGSLPASTNSLTVPGIPLNGQQIHVTLWDKQPGLQWSSNGYTLNTAENDVQTPSISSIFADGSTGFIMDWSSNEAAVDAWWVTAGPQPRSSHFVNSGLLSYEQTSYEQNGGLLDTPYPVTVYSTLWYRETVTNTWSAIDEVLPMPGQLASTPMLTLVNNAPTPEPGGIVYGDNPWFRLNDPLLFDGNYVTSLWLYIGATPNATDNSYFDSGLLTTDPDGRLVFSNANLPEDDSDFYVTVWYQLNELSGADPERWFRQTHRFRSSQIHSAD